MVYYSDLKKKKILPYATTQMNLEDIMLSQITQSQKNKYLNELSKIVKLLEMESRMAGARAGGEGNEKEMFSEYMTDIKF